MSDDALAYLVEAFGHVSEAEMRSFLDAPTVGRPAPATPETGKAAEAILAAALARSSERPAPAQAAWA